MDEIDDERDILYREIYRLRFIEIILPLKLLYKSVGFVIHHR